jgi:hypothetical protein
MAPAALVLSIAALATSAALLWRLREPARMAAPALDRAIARLEAGDAVLRYQVRIPAGTPVHFDVPIDQRYQVRLNTTLPVNTTVRVPLQTPLGTHTVEVPLRANLPIRTDLPVHLRDTFRLRTETRAEMVVPLEIPLRDLPWDALRRALDP